MSVPAPHRPRRADLTALVAGHRHHERRASHPVLAERRLVEEPGGEQRSGTSTADRRRSGRVPRAGSGVTLVDTSFLLAPCRDDTSVALAHRLAGRAVIREGIWRAEMRPPGGICVDGRRTEDGGDDDGGSGLWDGGRRRRAPPGHGSTQERRTTSARSAASSDSGPTPALRRPRSRSERYQGMADGDAESRGRR